MVDTHAPSSEAAQPTVAQFPIITNAEQICISFQVKEAPPRFRAHDRHAAHTVSESERTRGALFEQYRNVQVEDGFMSPLGLKLVSVNVRDKQTQKGLRKVVYFWFAPLSDKRNFRDPEFLAYAMNAFHFLSQNVYAEGESYANENGPACIALKGVAQCAPKTILSLCAGELQTVTVPA